jgi:hypothetical protein
MLTPEDIKRIIKAQKEVFVTKDEFYAGVEDIKKSIATLQSSLH